VIRSIALIAAAAAAGLGLGLLVAGDDILPVSPETRSAEIPEARTLQSGEMPCGDFGGILMTSGECFAAGTIRFVGLYNLQGAAQFCKWRAANPGEWTRIKTYAGTGDKTNVNVVTWLGGSIVNGLEAYFVLGAPVFTIQPNTSPNRCKTPLAPPVVAGITPGETDVTVTIED
jgi:hypothetical protein